MKPIDKKTRENIVSAMIRGEKRETIALWLGVSISTVDKIWRLYKDTNDILPKPYRGSVSRINAQTEQAILEAIKINHDATLEELIDDLSLPLTKSGLWRWIDRKGITFKKNDIPVQSK